MVDPSLDQGALGIRVGFCVVVAPILPVDHDIGYDVPSSRIHQPLLHTHITYGYLIPCHHGCDVRGEVREALACEAEREVA